MDWLSLLLWLQVVTSLADPSASITFGAVVDDRYTGETHVTIIATGFPQSFQKALLTDPKAAKLEVARETNARAPLTAETASPSLESCFSDLLTSSFSYLSFVFFFFPFITADPILVSSLIVCNFTCFSFLREKGNVGTSLLDCAWWFNLTKKTI